MALLALALAAPLSGCAAGEGASGSAEGQGGLVGAVVHHFKQADDEAEVRQLAQEGPEERREAGEEANEAAERAGAEQSEAEASQGEG